MSDLIHGRGSSKGGGGGGSEAPNTLKSNSFAKILDLLSEGEIEGLVDGAKSIYLDGVPLESPDGTRNFSDFQYSLLTGSQDQPYLADFANVQSEVVGPGKVSKEAPGIVAVTGVNIDALRVTVSVPRISKRDKDTGDVSGHEIEYKIWVSKDLNNPYVLRVHDKIEGKTNSLYERSATIHLPDSWKGITTYIKVERVSPDTDTDSDADKLIESDLNFASYSTIIFDRLTYPNSAIVGLNINAEYFSSVPKRAYDMRLMRVKKPVGYTHDIDTDIRTYPGIWEGNFDVAWTDNPAWCYYDLLTNPRYGVGQYIPEDLIDKWTLYELAKYCDTLVSDGTAEGMEPRYTCNMYIQTRQEALTVIRDMTKIFRGMAYWSGETLSVSYDHDDDPEALFTNANVLGGVFNYSGTSLASKKNVALVSWNDPENAYERVVEYVEDSIALEKDNVQIKQAEITAVGCTSRGQAHRIGKWLLYSENNEAELITFSANAIAGVTRPGSLISVSDKTRNSTRRGGRIKEVLDNFRVRIDSNVILTGTSVNTLHLETITPQTVTRADFTVETKHIGTLESVPISQIIGDLVTFGDPLVNLPAVDGMWVLEEEGVAVPALYKIISIEEDSSTNSYKVTASKHNPSKYDYIEKDLILEKRKTSDLNSLSSTPVTAASMSISESLYIEGSQVYNKVELDWGDIPGAKFYVVHYKRDNGNWEIASLEANSSFQEINRAQTGNYYLRVSAVNSLGRRSEFTQIGPVAILGKLALPSTVQNFSSIISDAGIVLTWDHIPDLDLKGYEIRVGVEWDSAELVSTGISNNTYITTSSSGVAGTFTYFIKSIDTGNRYSDASSETVTIIPTIGKVYGFTCAQVDSRLDFSWRKAVVIGLAGYEIREGVTWGNSSFLALVDTNKYSTSYGSAGTRNFLIKAVSSTGVKSTVATTTTTDIAKPRDLNKIYSQDERTGDRTEGGVSQPNVGPWSGNYIDAEVDSGALVSQYGKLSGEYITTLTLPSEYTAQSSISATKTTTILDGETWDTAVFDWVSHEAGRPWKLLFEDDIGDVEFEIATGVSAVPFEIEAIRYETDTTAISGNTPSINEDIFIAAGAEGRYSSGIDVLPISVLEYIVSIPASFSQVFWIRPSVVAGSFTSVRLEHTTNLDFLEIQYWGATKQLKLVDDQNNVISLDYEVIPGTLLAVAISQDTNTRRLFASNMQGNNISSSEENIPPTSQGYNLLKVS